MPVTVEQLQSRKHRGPRIVALTAWDFTLAHILDQTGIDLVLVGDSLGMVALGYDTTLPVTLAEMLHHTKAVRRGVSNALVVMDLPFMSYQSSPQQALASAGRALKEAGAQAVKLEGGQPRILKAVRRLVEVGIPVVGHLGLTPQSVRIMGYRQQGTTDQGAATLRTQAQALAAAGIFALVLEHIPAPLAATITAELPIPTIGIGAGPACDGQVLVTADLLGLSVRRPPFAPAYLDLRGEITQVVGKFAQQVREGA